MRFEIAQPVKSGHVRARFYVEILVMHGDADSYDSFDMGPFHVTEEGALADLIETLRRVKSAHPQGEDGYQHIEGFRAWFDEDYGDKEDPHLAILDEIGMEPFQWPTHPYAPYQGKLDTYKVVWYDSFGYKFDVDVLD